MYPEPFPCDPWPEASAADELNDFGQFHYACRSLEQAKGQALRCCQMVFGYALSHLLEDEEEPETYQIVTTLRQDVLRGIISKESPMGRALMGRRVGDRAVVELDNGSSYEVVIQAIEKGEDDGSLPLNRF